MTYTDSYVYYVQGVTLFLTLSAIVSGLFVLLRGTHKGQHYFADKAAAYAAISISVSFSILLLFNTCTWIIGDEAVHLSHNDFWWWAYLIGERVSILLFHNKLAAQIVSWRRAIDDVGKDRRTYR